MKELNFAIKRRKEVSVETMKGKNKQTNNAIISRTIEKEKSCSKNGPNYYY